MRMALIILAAVLISPARGDDDLKPLVEKALSAAGGKKLADAKAWRSTVRLTLNDGSSTLVREYTSLPDRHRLEQESIEDGKKSISVTVYNGDKGWMKNADGSGSELPRTRVDGSKRSIAIRTFRQVLRLNDPKIRLSALGESKVGGRAVLGIRQDRDGEISYFIDKENGRLLKTETLHQKPDGSDDIYVSLYEDYREAGGVMVAHERITMHNGDVTGVGEVVDFRIVDKLDDKLFEKP